MDEKNLTLIGERLREARRQLGLTQADAAGNAGLSREQWGLYERGASMPGGDAIYAFASMGIDVLYLLTGTRTPGAPTLGGDHLISPEEAALLDNYRNSGPEGRRAIATTSAALAQSREVRRTG